MHVRQLVSLTLCSFATGCIPAIGVDGAVVTSEPRSSLPISFEVNQGQADTRVSFVARGNHQTLLLSPTGIIMGAQNGAHESLRLSFIGGDSGACAEGIEGLPGKVNYFVGNDPACWHAGIPTFGKVRLEQVYPGIDVVFYGNQQRLEFDLVVDPGANLSRIRLGVEDSCGDHSFGLAVDDQGDLRVCTNDGESTVLGKPVMYQVSKGVRQKVQGQFVLAAEGQVGFSVENYNPAEALIIDPILTYSTLLGGSNAAVASGIAVDAKGCAYITGEALSTDFTPSIVSPHRYGVGGEATDAFVCKFSQNGSALEYVTYLGGSGFDTGIRIAVDAHGNAYVIGATTSTNFPTRHAFQSVYGGGNIDSFVVKLLADGSLDYSTYLGGSGQDANFPCGIAVDTNGSAYVVGSTASTDFPVTAEAYQTTLRNPPEINAFIAKLTPNGTGLVYATYLGGSDGDFGYGIAVDKAGNAYVCGSTLSTNFPTVNALQPSLHPSENAEADGDAFIAKLNPSGSALIFSTYFGGGGDEDAKAIAVDGAGNIYFAGGTDSADFPVVNPLQAAPRFGDAYIAKLDPTGTNLLYSTNIGGSDSDGAEDIAVDSTGNAYITGTTDSGDFPVTNAVQPIAGVDSQSDLRDAFVVKINPSGTAFVYSTYLGGSGDDEGIGIAVNSRGEAYVTGFSSSDDFPLVHAFQTVVGGSFVTKIHDTPAPPDHDFSVQAILVPNDVTLSLNHSPSKTRRLVVRLQNLSNHSDTIATFNNLTNLVALSVSGCDGDQPVLLQPTRKFPITLDAGATLRVAFSQLFESCAGDYTFSASLNTAALDGIPDSNTENDTCPRATVLAMDGTVIDPGCGTPNPDHTLGADVVTHVHVKN